MPWKVCCIRKLQVVLVAVAAIANSSYQANGLYDYLGIYGLEHLTSEVNFSRPLKKNLMATAFIDSRTPSHTLLLKHTRYSINQIGVVSTSAHTPEISVTHFFPPRIPNINKSMDAHIRKYICRFACSTPTIGWWKAGQFRTSYRQGLWPQTPSMASVAKPVHSFQLSRFGS